ncbi:MAG: glycosyltransferase, partial [Candidatus Omnitrophica bacterium]|nr:glycosyltransferase [Candidatus Omnitrophota bacterium]
MNILHLTTHLNVGGITSYLLTLSKQLIKAGHRVYIVSSGGEMVGTFESVGVKCINLPIKTKSELSPRIYWALPAIVDCIKKYKIDAIHSHTRITQVMGFLLQKLTNVKYVATCHGFFKPRTSRRVFPCWGEKTIAISDQVRDHLIGDFGLSSERVILIHNGIDLEDFSEVNLEIKMQKRKTLGLDEGPILGIIARLSDVKGHSVLLDAMSQIVSHFSTVKLLIVGQGKMEDQLKAQVAHLNLGRHVHFYPVVNRTGDFLSVFDVFVMPSLQEG